MTGGTYRNRAQALEAAFRLARDHRRKSVTRVVSATEIVAER